MQQPGFTVSGFRHGYIVFWHGRNEAEKIASVKFSPAGRFVVPLKIMVSPG
jgi:hypothetical protein